MLEARDTTPNQGPVVVTCDNPNHATRRFPTVALAESFLLGNAILGDCLWQHTVSEPMRELGELLASLIDDEEAPECDYEYERLYARAERGEIV